ncbi:DNA polymerase III subunit gamma/tau [Candidatus Saccharibacteria bacterium]|nr:DNA polymerase III subunit gamma/tau [Candidatus Saccharibacteria bacterium]
MSEALYRKHRSRGLDEIIGQDHVTDILKVVIKDKKPSHAYLFTGPRGVGKTSLARILAHEFNELPYEKNSLDIIEIDAASHGGVDDARDLRDKAVISPSELKYKVYIIDEVHMLSRQAFDALLKLIEEPPAHTIFIMATTEVDKVPATIKSRAHQYHLRLAPQEIIAKHLKNIAQKESLAHEPEALTLLAELGAGSFRDAISLLDQVSGEAITVETVERVFGLTTQRQIDEIISAMSERNTERLYEILSAARERGSSGIGLADQIIRHLEKLAPSEPRYFELIDRLLDVRKSTAPNLKLMAILANWSAPVAASLKSETPKNEPAKKSEKKTEYKVVEEKVNDPAISQKIEETTPPARHQINWLDVVDEIAKTNPMVATNLRKSEHAFDGNKLTITPATSLTYKTTNSAKNLKLIVETIRDGYGFTPEVEILEK